MNHQWLRWITDFGDTGVVLPLAILVTCLIWYAESVRAAWLFSRTVLGCFIVMTVLKVLFLSCGHYLHWGIASPSGHASMSAVFYGSLAAVLWVQVAPRWRALVPLAAITLIVAVAVSRVLLHDHTPQEVLLGLSVGSASALLFAWSYRRLQHPHLQAGKLGGGALLMLAAFTVFYGTILPSEQILRGYLSFLRICAV